LTIWLFVLKSAGWRINFFLLQYKSQVSIPLISKPTAPFHNFWQAFAFQIIKISATIFNFKMTK